MTAITTELDGETTDQLDTDEGTERDDTTDSLDSTEPTNTEGGDDSGANAEHAAPATPPAAPLEVPSPEPVAGLIQGLAESIAVKGSLVLAITKLEDESLLVSIQPMKTTDESAGAALPLQVTGSPAEIDASLLDALAHYVPARKLAIQTAAEIALATTTAAQTAREQAAKRAEASKPKPKTGTLCVKVTPKDAVIKVTDSAGKAYGVTQGKRAALPVGRYTITVEKDGHEPETTTATVGASPVDISVDLKLANLALDFGGARA